MIVHYYNEWDKGAAAWLRELINNKLIPYGYVDERSITEVTPSDLEGFTQCHFFAGIGGWPLALQLAGVPTSTRLWTGSPPCQPFSTAGKQLGQFDERHLAPVFLNLVSKCRPPVLFGEQVAPAIAKSWMCDLQTHLEGEDYAVGFAVLPACSVGAPHKRDRLFFGAHQLAHTDSERLQRERRDSDSQGREGQNVRPSGLCYGTGIGGGVANSESDGWCICNTENIRAPNAQSDTFTDASHCTTNREQRFTSGWADPNHGFWSDADWLGCRDGKFRPVEPGTFPLANGIPARVGRLRGYGNAIVPQVAAEFVKAFMESI